MIDNFIEIFNTFINEDLLVKANSLLWRVLFSAIIIIIVVELIKLFKRFLKKTFKKFKLEPGIANFLISMISVVLYIILAFIIAQAFGLDAAGIVALLGSAGVTVGLAIQGSLSNIAGGVLIMLLKPFKVGDYIIEDTNMNEGTVTEIGLIYTKLLTVDCKTIILPNGTLANASVVNVTDTPNRLIELHLDVSYDTDMVLAKALIYEVLQKEKTVLQEMPMEVLMEAWESSSIKLLVRFYVKNADFRNTKSKVLENVKMSFDMNNVEIPFNQLVLHNADAKPSMKSFEKID